MRSVVAVGMVSYGSSFLALHHKQCASRERSRTICGSFRSNVRRLTLQVVIEGSVSSTVNITIRSISVSI